MKSSQTAERAKWSEPLPSNLHQRPQEASMQTLFIDSCPGRRPLRLTPCGQAFISTYARKLQWRLESPSILTAQCEVKRCKWRRRENESKATDNLTTSSLLRWRRWAVGARNLPRPICQRASWKGCKNCGLSQNGGMQKLRLEPKWRDGKLRLEPKWLWHDLMVTAALAHLRAPKSICFRQGILSMPLSLESWER